MPIVQTIKMYRGEDVTLHFNMTPPEDITGWVISLTVAKNYDTTVKAFQLTAVATNAPLGLFDVIIPKSITINLNPDKYVHDVWRVNPGSERILSVGDFILGADARFPV